MTNKPRGGNRPGLPTESVNGSTTENDGGDRKQHSLVSKVESGLAEPRRDTSQNRFLAKRNGWTEKEYLHWVDTGDPPIRSVVKSTPASRPDAIDDDERLHR